jgi:formamidopyrimidine-DNA glycosylase
MPELPEVEVTRRGIAARIQGRVIDSVTIRNRDLRWPVPLRLARKLAGATVQTVERRGKFILCFCRSARSEGVMLLHLGMTGTLQLVPAATPLRAHDHVDFRFGSAVMRFNDPRRFGAILWHDAADGDVFTHSRHLQGLGVEPLSQAFAGEAGGHWLHRHTRARKVAIKSLLLAGQVVVGVGNIYASESLFRAGIDPRTPAGRIGVIRYQRLAQAIRTTLAAAIERGGSTLRDFVDSSGSAGYFQQEYFVYDRARQPCRVCGATIRSLRQGQRSTFYCPHCQRG